MTHCKVKDYNVPYVDCTYIMYTPFQKTKKKSHGKGTTETWTIEFIPEEVSKF